MDPVSDFTLIYVKLYKLLFRSAVNPIDVFLDAHDLSREESLPIHIVRHRQPLTWRIYALFPNRWCI